MWWRVCRKENLEKERELVSVMRFWSGAFWNTILKLKTKRMKNIEKHNPS